MNPDKQRIAIAEACGWHRCGPYTVGRSGNQRTIYKGIHPHTSLQRELPDYLNDLNAMHEAENVLSPMGIHVVRDYFETLDRVCGNRFESVSATAAQRAEAFLRTIGKWGDV